MELVPPAAQTWSATTSSRWYAASGVRNRVSSEDLMMRQTPGNVAGWVLRARARGALTFVTALGVVWAVSDHADSLRASATPQIPELVAGSVTTLEPGAIVERELGRQDEHLYQLTLAQDECVSVIVEQRGIDVIV